MFSKKLLIYRVINNITLPLACAPATETISPNIGDLIIIEKRNVWVQDWNNEEGNFSLVHCNPEFITINQEFFEEIS